MPKEKDPLKTVFSGAIMLLIGYVLGGVLTLGTQVLLARFFQPELYGVFSQGMAVLYTLVMVSMLGLNAGIPRHISFNNKSEREASKAVGSSLSIVLPFSLLVFSLLYLFAEPVANLVFRDQRMIQVLRIFAIAGPAMAVNSIFISGFRGHQKSRERVLLLDFIIPFLQIFLIGLLLLLGYNIGGAVAGYAAAFIIATGIVTYWYRKNHELSYSSETLESLVKLSWPLMVSAVVVQIFLWSPPILVGVFSSSKDVGFLNTALPLAASTKMFLSAVAFLYLPVVAELVSDLKEQELINVHTSTTRWIAYLSLPVLFFFIVFSSSTLGFIFGDSYREAGVALTIMAAGYLFNALTGPVGELLISVGKTKREMVANVVRLSSFLLLGALLIPNHGFVGGAFAYATGMALGNILRLWFCRQHLGFFYNREFLKPLIAVGISSLTLILPTSNFPIQLVAWTFLYSVSMALMKPLDEQDYIQITNVLQEFELRLSAVDRVLMFLKSDYESIS